MFFPPNIILGLLNLTCFRNDGGKKKKTLGLTLIHIFSSFCIGLGILNIPCLEFDSFGWIFYEPFETLKRYLHNK